MSFQPLFYSLGPYRETSVNIVSGMTPSVKSF